VDVQMKSSSFSQIQPGGTRTAHRGRRVATFGAWALLAAATTTTLNSVPASAHTVQARAVVVAPTVPVGSAPAAVAYDAQNHTLYIANQNASSVSVVNADTCNAKTKAGCSKAVHTMTLTVGAMPVDIAIDSATHTLYVADLGGGGSVSVINASSCSATAASGCAKTPVTVSDPGGAINLAVDQVTDTVYATNATYSTMAVLNGATCNAQDTTGCSAVAPTVATGATPGRPAIDVVTDTVYVPNQGVGDQGDTVSVINGATCNGTQHSGCGQTPATITVGKGPVWVTLDATTHTAYIMNGTDGTVSLVNTTTCNADDTSSCDQVPPAVAVGSDPAGLTIDPALHTLYAVNNWDDTLSVINTATCNATVQSGCSTTPPSIQVGAGADAVVAVPTTGTLYAANSVDNTVSVITAASCDATNTKGCRVQAPAATVGVTGAFRPNQIVGAEPDAVAVDPATSSVYVANEGANTVSVLNGATCSGVKTAGCAQVAATIHLAAASYPTGLAIDQATATLYVTDNGGNTVSVINAGTCNATDQAGCTQTPPTVTVGAGPFAIAVNATTDTVYVTDLGPYVPDFGSTNTGDTVSVINGATCNASDAAGCAQTPPTVTVGEGPAAIAVNPVTNTVYVANNGVLYLGPFGDTVSVIDGITCNGTVSTGCGKAPALITVGPQPYGVAVDSKTNTIFVANTDGGDGPGTLGVIRGATCDATVTIGCTKSPPVIPGLGRGTNGILFDPATDAVYTANLADATVSVVSVGRARSSTTPARVAVGGFPKALALDPANHTIYVANRRSGTVSVFADTFVR
jgi:DNA-binding beta-propeller fold protein YncE